MMSVTKLKLEIKPVNGPKLVWHIVWRGVSVSKIVAFSCSSSRLKVTFLPDGRKDSRINPGFWCNRRRNRFKGPHQRHCKLAMFDRKFFPFKIKTTTDAPDELRFE